MPTDIEYAQLANRVYKRTDENRTPIPTGWQELRWLPDSTAGFSAGVYKNGNDIVISYTGTNEAKAADFLLANIPIGKGATSIQVIESMRLYFEVKAANPGANISFTGHSLGGGLASMMAVFFDKQAVIFDPAPFEIGARNLESLLQYRAWEIALGYSDAAFDSYATSINFSEFAARESKVRSIAIENEILGVLRAGSATIYGGVEQTIPIGAQTLLSGGFLSEKAAQVELHSMTLLAAMLTSSKFAQAVQNNSQSLAAIFDSNLYKTNPETSNRANFIDKLYIAQVSNPATPLLDRFGQDMNRIGAEGMTGQPAILKALTVAAMEYFYFKEATSATALFTNAGNALHFKYSDIGATSYKSLSLLAQAIKPFLDEAGQTGQSLQAQLLKQDAWHIQSGTSGMNWTATDSSNDVVIGGAQTDIIDAGEGNDILIGGAGADFLTGGSGNDYLEGGLGNDFFIGGAGNDTLVGGQDNDTYQFTGSFGHDTILDADGLGSLQLDGATLKGGRAVTKGYGAHLADELLYGTAQADVILGGGGKDTIFAGAVAGYYKKRSCLSRFYLGYRAKRHVKTSFQGVCNV